MLLFQWRVFVEMFNRSALISVHCYTDQFERYPQLPDATCLNDEFLALLLQALRIEGVPATVLVTPGYRATAWNDDSLEVS